MAKIIGAEGQRALSYNLRREDEKKNARDNRSARSRISMGKELEKMSMDSDIDNPTLGYLSAAVQADPTGPIGAIAQAFGSIQKTKAMKEKKSAIKGRSDLQASLIQDNLKNLYGEEVVSELNERMDPEGASSSDPGYWNALSKNLGAEEAKSRQEVLQDQADDLYNQNSRLNEQNLELRELDNAKQFSAYTDSEKAREETAKQNEIFEKGKPALRTFLEQMLGSDEANKPLIEMALSSRDNITDIYNQMFIKKTSDKEKGDLWDFNPFLQEKYPDKEFFKNLDQYPPLVVQEIVQRASAQTAYPQYQQLTQQLNSSRMGLGNASSDIVGQSEAAAFPVLENIDGEERYTADYMQWYNNKAKDMGYDLDDNTFQDETDPVKIFEHLQRPGGEMAELDASMPAQYVREKANEARANETYDSLVGGYQAAASAPYLANIDTINKKVIELKQRYPGLGVNSVPRYESDAIQQAKGRTLPPGSVFQGTNGGFYITLGKEGMGAPQTIEGLSIPILSDQAEFESRTGSPFGFPAGTHSQGGVGFVGDALDSGETLDVNMLRQNGIPFTNWGTNNSYGGGTKPKNAGYRELTAKELEMVKMMNSQLMPTGGGQSSLEAKKPGHL